ncbi:hypothetical protein M0805_002427 [Coniferiporia weirii]|nr:hypothetical protein M0805_002427 [Coniferiporia weirii]
MPPWNPSKTKVRVTLLVNSLGIILITAELIYAVLCPRIAVHRLRLLQGQKEAQAKASRRDIAALLEQRKIEKARVKVESIISEDIHVELLELLELYCELLIARFGLLEQNSREPDPGISEGVCSIIYAAPRTELKELHVLRDFLMHKYGREFSVAVMENKDNCVSERVTKKLEYKTPPQELVDAYLGEIAKGYGVVWTPEPKDDDSDDGGGLKESVPSRALELPLPAEGKVADESLPKLPDIPPTEDSEKPSPVSRSTGSKPPPSDPPRPKSHEDELAALAKRFEALRGR